MFLRKASLLLFLFFIANSAFAAAAQKSFSDWQVTCNNQNFCSARNSGLHKGLVMTLTRSAGAHTDATLRIDLGNMTTADMTALPIASQLLVDGELLVLDAEKWQITPHHLKTGDADAINGFLEKVGNADAITLKQGKGNISLSGLKASLLFIDSQQQRVGSETAWVKKGDDPPLSVPPAPALKAVKLTNPTPTPLTQVEVSDLMDYGSWRINSSQCSLDPARRDVRVFAVSDDKALLMIGCEAGAYNIVDLAWVVSRQKPFAARQIHLKLPFTPASGNTELELMNSGYDETNKELTTLAKGRGIGDCGVATRWRFDGQRFRLVRYAEEPTCDGWNASPSWPTLWVTK
ncbi:putative exported protein [Buttiauxella ferragutiae ATCC 51602]|uniref:Exported protein n=1 Tax=Buttiauxella ferragutiae ATCC 51602 TaxID=1354252 RepID=A0ABX2W8Q9_9ENTR|nr:MULTISPECIES: DUF1176 domain-containing protein [Buttiauxella]AYN29390.1 DUF1176 domain-containing protein [Buttiauxella sp. 3AFRM03]MCE0825490.1 DUF1176 domain-containing protein [Buttiauxella ferragutiae]OAT28002.1 putative exported protein [Buttiauxella ferragutiae ATCC 51602]TDN55464.1 uncharacterized protein DUF1176 [Buttiauxella sp. JUb87]UNK62525.1 DUF1176 domain-containing protein [Buttiauxella ferragutiae]